ncbi:aldehyde dehydrogenase family 2 member B7, mitochondrial [Artemisia annua]|uniref:Aldehyde dehydrogenase family 2 member B7, mitochondrial n=1 Tax=Artemisia annua TaxID=35608 RepID=A0A2U1QDS3_ARTAN|nr:aldehyde dehydrogenase family 2 member B7, mitochondrial [Artemisia annua]
MDKHHIPGLNRRRKKGTKHVRRKQGLSLIDGKKWSCGSTTTLLGSFTRASWTGEVMADVAEGDSQDIKRATSAARKAFYEVPWSRMTGYVSRLMDLIVKNLYRNKEVFLTELIRQVLNFDYGDLNWEKMDT